MIPRLSDVDLEQRLQRTRYETALRDLQLRLRVIQLAYRKTGLRGIVVIEGWDAAGKGGLVRRMVHEMDPRGYKVWPIGPPSPDEQGRHYLYRFWTRLPVPGSIAIFDRSWYGRVLVERVEAQAAPDAWQRAYDEINDFEEVLTNDGVRIAKLFMHMSEEEQAQRFSERAKDPNKRWKLTSEDLRNRSRRREYEDAITDMLERTSRDNAPWKLVSAEQKRFGRIEAMEYLTGVLAEGVDLSPPTYSEAFREQLSAELGLKLKPEN
jgi:polyphosphate kinase 2 (PPK2 family)